MAVNKKKRQMRCDCSTYVKSWLKFTNTLWGENAPPPSMNAILSIRTPLSRCSNGMFSFCLTFWVPISSGHSSDKGVFGGAVQLFEMYLTLVAASFVCLFVCLFRPPIKRKNDRCPSWMM